MGWDVVEIETSTIYMRGDVVWRFGRAWRLVIVHFNSTSHII